MTESRHEFLRTEPPPSPPSPPDPRLTVFVVEDDPLDRDFLSLLLGRRGYQLQCFPSAEAFLDRARPEWAGCVLADHRLRGMTGCELLIECRQRLLPLPFLIISAYADIAVVRQVFQSGAKDFLEKPINPNQLFEQIDHALATEKRRLDEVTEAARLGSFLEPLTEREKEVAVFACQGMANRDIAQQLGISHRTVETHKARVIAKLGAKTSADLIRLGNRLDPERLDPERLDPERLDPDRPDAGRPAPERLGSERTDPERLDPERLDRTAGT